MVVLLVQVVVWGLKNCNIRRFKRVYCENDIETLTDLKVMYKLHVWCLYYDNNSSTCASGLTIIVVPMFWYYISMLVLFLYLTSNSFYSSYTSCTIYEKIIFIFLLSKPKKSTVELKNVTVEEDWKSILQNMIQKPSWV